MNVSIQSVNWQVPFHNGEPFLGYPKWKVVNGEFENNTQTFYRINDADQKYCWMCREFIPADKFFWLAGETFYAEKMTNGKNAPYCMTCSPQRRTCHKHGEWK